jgi:chromosome segregation ATPase
MTTEQMQTSMTKLAEEIAKLDNDIELIKDDNTNLDDEIHMVKASLVKVQEDYQTKKRQVEALKSIDELLKEEKKAREDLEKIENKVKPYLDLVEEMETTGALDEEATGRALLKERGEQELTLRGIRAELEDKLKQLSHLEKDASLTV